MEYTIKKLAQLAGISTRTLRHYHNIGLLKPKRINSSGYRIYGQDEVDLLQQILFYRNLEMSLEEIKQIIAQPDFDSLQALMEHRRHLVAKKAQLDLLIATIDKTMKAKRGEAVMLDNEKFAGFKQRMIDENERKYGEEARRKYGNETVEASNRKFAGLSEEEFNKMQDLAGQINADLKDAMKTGDPAGEAAQNVAREHKQWLSYTWPRYSAEAHRGLAQMYVDDERFTAYYDQAAGEGAAEFLREAIFRFTETDTRRDG